MGFPHPRAIIFDLGKVIVPFDFGRGYRALEALCPHPAAEIPARIGRTGLVERLETGKIEPKSFVERLSRQLDLQIEYPEFCRIWSSIFFHPTLVPEELLEGLKRHYQLLLLSNTNSIHFESIQREYPILRYFDHFVLSYQVGAMKPDPAIYQRAIHLAECGASECLFIDDLEANVEGARRAGMDAIRFEAIRQLEEELKKRGIRWD